MVHDVVDARLHLVVGYGHRKLGIQDRELGHQSVIEHVAHLERMLGISTPFDNLTNIQLFFL